MNLQQRLDLIGKNLPKTSPTTANPFADMTNDQLRQLTGELGQLVKSKAEQDPTTLDKLDPALLSLLRSEGLLD